MADATHPPEEEQKEINRASIEAALELAAHPSLTNRFELFPGPVKDHVILVLGGVLAGTRQESGSEPEHFRKVNMHGAYLMNRRLATDIAAKLQHTLSLTDEEVREARNRYARGQ